MRIFQPIITGSAVITGNLEVAQGVTGSFTGSLTGSLYGTASWAISSSHALTASYALNAGGSGAGFPFTGSAEITGSLIVTGSVTSTIGFTGSLEGTASWAISASQSISSSYATSASYAQTASYAINALSASYAATASYSLRTIQTDVLVKNQAGFNIPKGTVVRITGSNNASDIPRVVTASYENDNNSANTLGITTELITNGSEGYVITEGVLTGIDTSNYVSGQLIYLGPTGSITGSAPLAPLHAVRLGEVIRTQSNNGSIYVRIDNGYELDELHNVLATTAVDGDLLVKSGSVWLSSKQLTGSYGLTGSLVVKAGSSNIINASDTQGVIISDLSGNPIIDSNAGVLYDNIQNDASIDLFNRKLYRSNNIAPPIAGTVSVDWENGIFSGSLHGTSSWSNNSALLGGANRDTFITTGSSGGSQAITGSLTITQNLTVLGSSSIQYITSSQLVIEDNIISVNTITPAVRYGGIAVIDSGSSPVQSGSLLFDSQNNQWIFVHQASAGAALTSSVLIMGPQTFNNLGNETTITANRLTKGTGGDLGEHIGDSNITDTGTNVSINSNTQITGSLNITAGITGSLFGTASWSQNAQTASFLLGTVTSASFASTASYVNPLNQNVIITGSLAISGSATGSILSVSASYIDFDFDSFLFSGSTVFQSSLDATQANATFGTASITFGNITGSLFGTSSWAISSSVAISASRAISSSRADSALSASFASTASFVNPLVQNVFISGSTIITGSLIVTGSTLLTGSLTLTGRNTITGSFTASNSESIQLINQRLVHPATTGSGIYQTSVLTTFVNNSPNQTSTALRLNPTFTGSFSGSNTQNLIVDFGANNVGSQFTVNDVTSGSIYMVNDVSGLPIIEATSNWDVNIYDYPNVTFKKTGSAIIISGSLTVTQNISSSFNNISSDALIQAALLYLSTNC